MQESTSSCPASTLNGMKTLAGELERQGIRDKVKLLHSNSYDQAAVAAAGGTFDGDYVQVGFRTFGGQR